MRVDEDEEVGGIDQVQHAETAYDFSGAGGGSAPRTTAVPGPVQGAAQSAAQKNKKVDA